MLYCVLVNELLKHMIERGEYFLESLVSLMKGLPAQIDVRKDLNDSERFKNTLELIEEKVVPIVANLTYEEAQKAQDILKLNTVD